MKENLEKLIFENIRLKEEVKILTEKVELIKKQIENKEEENIFLRIELKVEKYKRINNIVLPGEKIMQL